MLVLVNCFELNGDLAMHIWVTDVENKVHGEHVYCAVACFLMLIEDLAVCLQLIFRKLFGEFEEVMRRVQRGYFFLLCLMLRSICIQNDSTMGNVGRGFLVDHEGSADFVVIWHFLQCMFNAVVAIKFLQHVEFGDLWSREL